MKKFVIISSLIFISLISTLPALAELKNCSGVLTNKACEEVNKKPTITKLSTTLNTKSRLKKDSLLHELRMLSIKAKREYKIDYDLDAIEEECQEINPKQCEKEVKSSTKELTQMINQAKLVKLKEDQNKLIKESNLLKKDRNQTTVIIQNNNVIIPKIPRRKTLRRNQTSSLPKDAQLPE